MIKCFRVDPLDWHDGKPDSSLSRRES
jgi:hypothetical protein